MLVFPVFAKANRFLPAGGAHACPSRQHFLGDELMIHHLNKHAETIACNTCHSPVYAKCKPTVEFWDESKAGDKVDIDAPLT